MTKVTLTEKEYEVMEILWKSEKPMLASEVTKKVSRASGNSTHHLLNRLMEKGVVKVAGNVKIVKAQSRLYAPAYTTAEYIAIQAGEIFKATTGKFDVKDMLACLVKKNKNKNDEIINEIKAFIDEYEKGIEQ
ncbi:MAG: BlaI/MecI/CopY family transcriptional regulator [Firmicutes bacterium]|nr:BlaI/MecI/CopY family transcriptional regulator [Bacillota bacterium]